MTKKDKALKVMKEKQPVKSCIEYADNEFSLVISSGDLDKNKRIFRELFTTAKSQGKQPVEYVG